VIEIRPASEADPAALLQFVVDSWGAETVVGHEEEMYPARHAGFVALREGRIVGHVTYRGDGERCEITTIQATPRQAGVGSMLMDAVLRAARDEGYRVVWLTTTNDNLDALRFYQRRGFRINAVRRGAVDRARATLKPEIPEVGMYGIRIRDELDLDLDLP
jgi:ribosomal protein S18 acetylase RimI-like enzyme